MANGLPYYSRFPRDLFEGTVDMTIELKGPYSLLIDLIYLHDGALPHDRAYIAGMLGMSVRKLNIVLPKLIALKKLVLFRGIITNPRADRALRKIPEQDPLNPEQDGSAERYNVTSQTLSQDNLKIISRLSQDNVENAQTLSNKNNDEASRARAPKMNIIDDDEEVVPFREMLLKAMGVDRSGLTGRGGTMLGSQADMAEVAQWLMLPHLNATMILAEVAAVTVRKADGPPGSFKYYRKSMQKLSAALSETQIQPEGGNGNGTTRSSRQHSADSTTDKLSRIIRAAAES